MLSNLLPETPKWNLILYNTVSKKRVEIFNKCPNIPKNIKGVNKCN